MPTPKCHLLYPRCGCPAPTPKRSVGQPRSPWRARKEAEARELTGLERRIIQAIEAGLGEDVLAATEAALARVSFSKFCQRAWPVIEPSTYLEWGRHHELICTVLQALFEDWWRSKQERGYLPLVRNVLINTPPGSLKPCDVNGLVLEEQRGYMRLGDVVAGDRVLTHRGRYRDVLRVAEQGLLPLLQFTTARGRQINVAGDHPMLTQRGWIRADQVTIQDVFAAVHAREVCEAEMATLETYFAGRSVTPDRVVNIEAVPAGKCRCLQVKEDSSFVYQGVAVHNSRLISVFFHAWVWLRGPGTKFVCVSVNESAAQRDARDTRSLLLSNWYQDNFSPSWTIKTDQDAISDFGNTDGGARLSRASGSVIVGLRGDCVAGGTPVATEIGEIEIAELHEMSQRGEILPRVWSVNHGNGYCELHAIQATRRMPERDVVDLSTELGDRLQCTADHRLFCEGYYLPASTLAGRKVLTLRGDTVLTLEHGSHEKVDVYDIQVEKNHNFFAGGILVHNCLIGDDLNDPEESDKQLERDKVNSLWDTNQYNRVNDPLRSLRICVQQRIHVNDHTGHVIAKQGLWSPTNRNGWLHLVLPAEMELSRPGFELPLELRKYVSELPDIEVCDWRTVEGQALHPVRMPTEWLEGEKKRWAGTSNYAGQMQQRPTAEGGGKIKRAWFNWFRLAKGVRPGIDEGETGRLRPHDCHKGDAVIIPAAHHRPGFWDFDQVVLSVDPAYKKTEKGSLWGMLAFGCKGARKYLLDDRSQRGEPDEAIEVMKLLVRTWLPDKILIEDKAGGAGMYRTLELAMGEGDVPMVELELVNPGTLDKDARINAAIPALANGMLYLLDGAPWLEEYVEELALYPNGMRNDRIDATTQAINHIRIDDCAFPSAKAWQAAMA